LIETLDKKRTGRTGRHMDKRIVLFLLTCLVVGLLTSGCLFEPRDAQQPGDAGTSWIAPDFPHKVFSNLETGLEELTGSNYERSIGAAFVFIPLPGDEAQFSEPVFEGWNRSEEVSVVQKLLAGASEIEVKFAPPTTIIDESDFTQYETIYNLKVTSSSDPSQTDTYKGKARFDMRLGGKGYELVKWEDIETMSGFPTWGYLRGTYKTF